MSMFKKRLVHLCPEINGRLMDGDKPLSGVTIERGIAYEKEYVSTTTTDNEGYFSFPVHEYETRKPLHPLDEQRVITYISANIDDEDKKIWHSVIFSLSPVEQLSKNLNTLSCDIHSPLKVFSISYGLNNAIESDIYTICNLHNIKYKGFY
ncbi:DUF6795 domain-containing protein [Vibrio sp. B1FLJ16]|nr:DUF6795 domain-containing protein [Vibrio sp. B1FLJ16]